MIRSDLHCTECGKSFVAKLDDRIDGNHVIVCPWCGHQHCRVIKDGKVTDDRYDSKREHVDVPSRSVWRTGDGLETSSASHFLREKWMERMT
jgi:DNA-directed RNA polymerase subunit RPC12/RpoP